MYVRGRQLVSLGERLECARYVPVVDGKAFIESHVAEALHSSSPLSVEFVIDLLFEPAEVRQVLPGSLRSRHCAGCG